MGIRERKCVAVCLCLKVCGCVSVSREKQIHLSFSDKDARNKEEGEILLQERLGKEGEPNRCPHNSLLVSLSPLSFQMFTNL